MKQTKLFLIAAFSLGMTACTNENYDSLSNHEVGDISTIKLSVENFVSENISRTDFIIDETGANFIWAENDTVGIFPNEGDQLGFPMSEGAGASVATFTGGGWSLKESSKYYAYFPFSRTNFDASDRINNIDVCYIGQSQNGNNNTKSLGSFDFMAAAETTSSNGALNFNFKHLGCLLKIDLTVNAATSYKKLSLNISEPLFTTEAKIKLQDNPVVLHPTNMTTSLSMDLKNITTAVNEKIVLYMMIAPTNLSNKKINFVLTDENDLLYNCIIDGKDYVAGKAYQISGNPKINLFNISDFVDGGSAI